MPIIKNSNPYIPPKFALLLTSFMVFIAYVCDDGVLLLPAFAPLAYGSLSGLGRWQCTRGMFVALLGISALLGVSAVKVGVGYMALNMLVVYVAVSGLMAMAGARLSPAYAVAMLPVFISEHRLLYVGVVLALALLIVSLCWNKFPDSLQRQSDGQRQMAESLLQTVSFFPLILMSAAFANPSFVLPGLWYVFVDMYNEERHTDVQSQVVQLLWAVLLGAVADVAALGLLNWMGVPGGSVVAAVVYSVSSLFALLLFYGVARHNIYIPALSFIVFPFLRDGETSYVLATDFSLVYLALSACVHRRLKGKII